MCVTAVWSAGPVRIYLVILLVWVAGRYGSFVLLALFWRVCLIEQVGGGWRGGTIFLVFSGLILGGTVRLKWRGGGAVFKFSLSQFAVNCLGGWICAVGILCYFFFVVFCSAFFWFLVIQVVDFYNLLQDVFGSSTF